MNSMQINTKTSEKNSKFWNNRPICRKVRAWNKQINRHIFHFWILVNLLCNCEKRKINLNLNIYLKVLHEHEKKVIFSNLLRNPFISICVKNYCITFFTWLSNGADHLEPCHGQEAIRTSMAGKHPVSQYIKIP